MFISGLFDKPPEPVGLELVREYNAEFAYSMVTWQVLPLARPRTVIDHLRWLNEMSLTEDDVFVRPIQGFKPCW